MGWGSHDVAVSMGLPGGNASLSRSLQRQLWVPGAWGAVTGWVSQGMVRQESQQRGHRVLFLSGHFLQSWEKGKKGGPRRGLPDCRESIPSCLRLCESLGFTAPQPAEEMVLRERQQI